MKLKPLKQVLAMSKEKVDEFMAPIRAKQVKLKAQLKQNEIDSELLSLESEIQEMCLEKEIDLDKLISKSDKIALLERRKKQYDKIIEQLFPEE